MIKLKHNGRYVTAEGKVVTVIHVDYHPIKPHYKGYKFWCIELNCWFTEEGTWKLITPTYAKIVKDISENDEWPCWL